MAKKYDVIVIGAGPGGMGCAGLLAKSGLKVVVIDKNPKVGGLLQRFTKDGFTFDFGTMAGLPIKDGRWQALYQALGVGDKYKVVIHPMMNLYRDPKTRKWRERLTDWTNPYDPYPVLNFLGVPKEEQEKALVPLMEMYGMASSPEKLAALEEVSAQDFVEGLKLPQGIASQLYMFCNGGVIHAKELVAASEMVQMFLKLMLGIAYPLGGMGNLSEILGEACRKLGVEFVMKKRVEKINIEEGMVTGVTLKGGEVFEAPIVVSSVGIQGTVLKLVGEDYFDKSYVNWVRGLIPSMGFTRCNYILSKPVMKYSYYQIFSDEAWWDVERYKNARQGIIPGDVTVSIVVNSNYDPSLAPKGKQIMQVGSNATPDPKDPNLQLIWDRTDEMMAEIFPEILPYIESKEGYIGPKQASALSRDSVVPGQGGEICGVAQIVGQIGKHKPKAEAPIGGLFYVGADAEGGPHMCSEMVVDSAMKVAPKVLRHHYKVLSQFRG